jgi:hypothetical protein
MKKYIFTLVILSLSLFFVLADTDNWNTAKSTHFIVYYKNASPEFIDKLIEKAEGYYDKIAEDLGFRRYNFWLWDERAKIYIYNDSKDYQAQTKQPGWSSGCAITKEKIIHSFPYARGFFESILPHEMGHIIFREFVGFDNYSIPLWLDEGVASYQEAFFRQQVNRIIRDAVNNNKLISLEKLSGINPQLTQDRELVDLFYAESINVIHFLINEFGRDNFILFCQHLRDKKDFEKALSSAYPFESIQELDRAWQKYVK